MKNARRFRNLVISKLNRIILNDECCSRYDKLKKDELDSEIYSMLETYIGSEFFENVLENHKSNIKNLSFENIIMNHPTVDNAVCGFYRLSNGEIFLGFMTSGDWQFPVNAALYYKHGFKIYVPKRANRLTSNHPFNGEDVLDDFSYDCYAFYGELENELRD